MQQLYLLYETSCKSLNLLLNPDFFLTLLTSIFMCLHIVFIIFLDVIHIFIKESYLEHSQQRQDINEKKQTPLHWYSAPDIQFAGMSEVKSNKYLSKPVRNT